MSEIQICVDAIIFEENGLIMVKRNTEPFKGDYALPGGRVEEKETLKDAIVREVKEETGLDVNPFAMLGVYDDVNRDPRGRIISVVFLCRPLDVIKQEDFKFDKNEISEVVVLPLKELVEGKHKIAYDHARMIKSYNTILQLGKKQQ